MENIWRYIFLQMLNQIHVQPSWQNLLGRRDDCDGHQPKYSLTIHNNRLPTVITNDRSVFNQTKPLKKERLILIRTIVVIYHALRNADIEVVRKNL
jgi:hypothetical protein